MDYLIRLTLFVLNAAATGLNVHLGNYGTATFAALVTIYLALDTAIERTRVGR